MIAVFFWNRNRTWIQINIGSVSYTHLGIINRLDYIRDLGCNAIWLNPCFDSPFTDAGYDVADYKKVAPRYGTNEDLKELFREAHSRGLRVILDLVPGHTSVQHPWFLESMKSQPNEFSNRYVWNDDIWDTFEGIQLSLIHI